MINSVSSRNLTQRNLGFSSTPEQLRAYLKSPQAKEDGVRLSHQTRLKADMEINPPGRKFCLFLTTDPKSSRAFPNVKLGGKDVFVYGTTPKEMIAKLAEKIGDGVLSFTKKVKIG
ncbi:MAG: hypothetical protein A2039_06570 [Candidatus Melainabacteria bacterium GWA2_34_9]|nr:MAG: hypothetical protein A2039_06570 [Candidatus Melainabacteria bacterium GWA2_34_9]